MRANECDLGRAWWSVYVFPGIKLPVSVVAILGYRGPRAHNMHRNYRYSTVINIRAVLAYKHGTARVVYSSPMVCSTTKNGLLHVSRKRDKTHEQASMSVAVSESVKPFGVHLAVRRLSLRLGQRGPRPL